MVNKIEHLNDFDAISLAVASPEQILSWSHGEIRKPETINYRTQKPERDGLFCEKIFGPTKNYECYCGKYKRIRYKGVICEKCGVEVTKSSVRRERMGHIKLAVPVTHIWFLRSTPSRIGLILNQPVKQIEQVVYFASYLVTQVNIENIDEALKTLEQEHKALKEKIQSDYQKELQSLVEAKGSKQDELRIESELAMKLENLEKQTSQTKHNLQNLEKGIILSELEYREMSLQFGHLFKAQTGAEAINDYIASLDFDEEIKLIHSQLETATAIKETKLLKRLKLFESLRKSGIQAEWMILKILPVIPPDLRPMVQLDGGRFAASDLNDLYRRVINRNNRLKKLLSIGAPEVICRNEKRMLQEAVDTLINISARQSRSSYSANNKRKLKSLSDFLKGKQGRFRQNLLGKRVDYSGRSVIVGGPTLKLNECGLPKKMALTLFKPFVLGKLIRDGYAHNIKSAEKLIQAGNKEVWDILDHVTQGKFVLLNRAPTLHRLGIQAFQPKLIEGNAIRIHPLVCAAFNADFDGDQMAVHLPLSAPAQKEAAELIQSSRNLLKPSSGAPIISPSQDIILGCYFLTKVTTGKAGQGMLFSDVNEVLAAVELGKLDIQSPIKINYMGELRESTAGKIIFNESIPEGLRYIDTVMSSKNLEKLIADCFEKFGIEQTAELADTLKEIGYKYVSKSGLSIAASDLQIPDAKNKQLEDATEEVKQVYKYYQKGLITDEERYHQTCEIWSQCKSQITEMLIKQYDDENHIHYMVESGARGKWGNVTQLAGMKGLVINPSGKTIELPIKSNLKEGFTILEYFIATHGGRKGKSDTALKTAEAGHLTRRLVDATQDLIVNMNDCGTEKFHIIRYSETEKIGMKLPIRIFGRVAAQNIVDQNGEIIVAKDEIITTKKANLINELKIEEIPVRSPLTCESVGGVCQKCYGYDLGDNQLVKIGAAAGIIAAQSIGEPATQLTMRTFHMGGVAGESDMTQGLTRIEEIFEARNPKSPAILSGIDGEVEITSEDQSTKIIVTSNGPVESVYDLPENFLPEVKAGDKVKNKQILAKTTSTGRVVRSEDEGEVTYADNYVIKVQTFDSVEKTYLVSKGKTVYVKNGESVTKGQVLTSGSSNLKELRNLSGTYTTLKYIIEEIQKIYSSQGQSINDKHVEIVARQMLSKVRITDPGESTLVTGQIMDRILVENMKKQLKAEGKKPIMFEKLLLGLTKTALHTSSWLSAASFQETIKILVEAATTKQVDHLKGLKENVIIGKLIPAGETFRKNQELNE